MSRLKQHNVPARYLILLALGIVILAGCSKEEIKQKMQDAQSKLEAVAESTVEAVEEKLPETGSITLQTTPATEASQADLELISVGDGRPSVVRIVSYDPSNTTRAYPAIMLQGTTNATSAAGLANQTVKFDMYLQASPSGPVAMTKPGESVTVTFRTMMVEDNALPATLSSAKLLGSDFRPVDIRGGEIVAVVRGEEN